MDHNEEFLREASTVIVDQEICVHKFNTSKFIVDRRYFQKFICTYGLGNIDSEGNIIDYGELVTDCANETETVTDSPPLTRAGLEPKLEPTPGPISWSGPAAEFYEEPTPQPELYPWSEPELDRRAKIETNQYDYYYDSVTR